MKNIIPYFQFSYFRLDLPSSDSNDSDDEYSELSAERLKLEMEIDAAFSSNISDFEQDGVGGDMDTKSLDRSVASSPFLETRENSNERRKLLKKRAGTQCTILCTIFMILLTL